MNLRAPRKNVKYRFSGSSSSDNDSFGDEDDEDDDFYSLSESESESDDSEAGYRSEVEDLEDSSIQNDTKEIVTSAKWEKIPEYTDTSITLKIKDKSFYSQKGKRPIDVYKNFISDDIIYIMVEETNRYADQYFDLNRVKPNARAQKWFDTDFNEMHKFIGIIMIMGIVKYPELRMYWSTGAINGQDIIRKTMSRDRFFIILKFWHFENNYEFEDSRSRLFKIEKILELFNDNCFKTLNPGTELVIDESMVPWRGRLVFRQYIKNKRHRYGVKLYKLCTVDGFTLNTIIYTGKCTKKTENLGHTHGVVLKLLTEYLHDNKILYCDNYYTSIGLAEDLLGKETKIVGTLRKNRKGIPTDLITQKLTKGQVIGLENSKDVKIFKWKDKRDVLMISTVPEHDLISKQSKRSNRYGQGVHKPKVILD